MVRPASDTYYVTVGTILMNLGVPSKLIGCIPKVADRYTTPLAPVTWGITFKTSAYAHDAGDVMSVSVCACCKDVGGDGIGIDIEDLDC